VNRRDFLSRVIPAVALGGTLVPGALRAGPEPLTRVAPAAFRRGSLRIPATLQPGAFASARGDDARYHALVHEEGGAASKALLTTPTSDQEIARVLREFGAVDGGGIPMSAWNLRRIPMIPPPNSRVQGSPVRILVEWSGWADPRPLGDLFQDPGGRGVRLRFGGNEDQNHFWDSGCVACLFSCPGGVISNDRYTIRDHMRGATEFLPAEDLPADGTRVSVVIELEA